MWILHESLANSIGGWFDPISKGISQDTLGFQIKFLGILNFRGIYRDQDPNSMIHRCIFARFDQHIFLGNIWHCELDPWGFLGTRILWGFWSK